MRADIVLVAIDVQRAFDEWEASGMLRNNPGAVARIAELLDGFRAAGAPVLHVRHAGTDPGSSFRRGSSGYRPMPGAEERPGEPVLVKSVNSAFIGTDLELRLRALRSPAVVLCGATSNHCVETTARMSGNLGFDTRFVEDATWTFDRKGPDGASFAAAVVHSMTLANLQGEFASVVSSRDVMEALREPS